MVLDTIKKNMKEKKQENSKFLKKKRKYIETVFSKLVNLFDIERIRVQSILGFRLRLNPKPYRLPDYHQNCGK